MCRERLRLAAGTQNVINASCDRTHCPVVRNAAIIVRRYPPKGAQVDKEDAALLNLSVVKRDEWRQTEML